MVADLPSVIKKVAEFMQVPLSADICKLIARRASIEHMREIRHRIDDPLSIQVMRYVVFCKHHLRCRSRRYCFELDVSQCSNLSNINGTRDALPTVTRVSHSPNISKDLPTAVSEDIKRMWAKAFPHVSDYNTLRDTIKIK